MSELLLSPAVMAIIGVELALIVYVFFVARRVSRMEVLIDTMWDFFLRRAKAELVTVGWAQMNSPIHITSAGLSAVMPFLTLFLPSYASMVKRQLSEQEMFIEFEREFGDFILQKVCIPQKVTMGACLMAIIKACETQHEE